MKPRMQFMNMAPELMKAMLDLSSAVMASGLDPSLLHLVKLRASQINGCSFCVDMHSREARQDGETEQRIYLVSAWKESPLFSDRERAVLAWTEAVTLIANKGVPDDLYQEALKHLSEEELLKLTYAVGMINTWNRLAISFHAVHPVARSKAA